MQGTSRASFNFLDYCKQLLRWRLRVESYNTLSRHVACFHSEAEGKIIKTRTMCSLQQDLSAVCLPLINVIGVFAEDLKNSTCYAVSFLCCGMTWITEAFLCLSPRMRGRSSARFWLRPRWSWTNWWRRSARLWTSPSLTGRHAGWPDRSVNSSWRERETGFKSFWTCSLQVLCRAPYPLCSQEPRND